MRKEKKLAKAMITLFIEDEEKKLYDRYKNMNLSHKRRTKLLVRALNLIKEMPADSVVMNFKLWKLKENIEQELSNPYLRHNWGVYNGNH